MQRVFPILWPAWVSKTSFSFDTLNPLVYGRNDTRITLVFTRILSWGFFYSDILNHYRLQACNIWAKSIHAWQSTTRPARMNVWGDMCAISCDRRNVDDRESALMRLKQSTSSLHIGAIISLVMIQTSCYTIDLLSSYMLARSSKLQSHLNRGGQHAVAYAVSTRRSIDTGSSINYHHRLRLPCGMRLIDWLHLRSIIKSCNIHAGFN